MRRITAITLTLAAAASLLIAPVTASANCGAIPDELCDEIPGTGCPYLLPEAVCGVWPKAPGLPGDQQLAAVQSNSYAPAEVSVRHGSGLIFHNMSTAIHTITHVGCVDGDNGTPCLFNKALERAQRLDDAKRIPITSAFKIGQSYDYVCTLHAGMGGSFTVLAP